VKVLDQLLQIKEFREDKAQAEVSRARGALTEADSALTRAKTHLDEHRADCDLRERQIYADLCTRQVRLTDLQDVALKVDEFKQSIQGCESRVNEATEHARGKGRLPDAIAAVASVGRTCAAEVQRAVRDVQR